MSDMVKRSAREIYPLPNVDHDDARMIARVAILAALDAAKGHPRLAKFHGIADQVIDELKALAEGDERGDGGSGG